MRFLVGLPSALRRPMSYGEAAEIVKERLRSREANFLAMLDRLVYQNSASPYRAMLKLAQCDYGDVVQLVRKRGLESTLAELRSAGVGVTFEEFKGRAPIVRGGQEISAGPTAFDSPQARSYLAQQSGGSTGPARGSNLDLSKLHKNQAHSVLSSHLSGGPTVPRVQWWDLPPSIGLSVALRAATVGERPAHWLSAVWPGHGIPFRYLWATRAVVLVARAAGANVPMPRYVPQHRAEEVARLVGGLLAKEGRCYVSGSVSRMVRVAVAARTAGIDLRGAVLAGGGEPPTPAKVAAIRSSGATFVSSYHIGEAGLVGALCRDSDDPNDQHLMLDHLAMIQVPRQVPGFDTEVNAFCFTSLLPEASKVLLNTEMDDYGVVTTRSCGCPWGALGLNQHVSEIRSFRKLTGEGVTLVGTDIERILEEVLPAAHGGSPLDYQLLEEEGQHGLTHVTLLVNPNLPGLSPEAVQATFLEAIAGFGMAAGIAHRLWSEPGVLRVRREQPRWTARGKLLPLQLDQRTKR